MPDNQNPLTLHITKLIQGGLGLARAEGRTVFVSDVIPGETVSARIVGSKAHCLLAEPAKILEPSPDRREPFCPYYGECGGCDLQHIAAERQIELKREIFVDCLRRIGKLGGTGKRQAKRRGSKADRPAAHQDNAWLENIELFRSPEQRYRLRAEFKVDNTAGQVGFFKRGTHQVVDVRSCPLLVEPLDRFLGGLRNMGPGFGSGLTRVRAIAGRERVASSPAIPGLSCPKTTIEVDKRRFEVLGGSFFQQNRHLLDPLGSWGYKRVGGKRCVDLYGGSGFFSVFLGDRFHTGLLVESQPREIELARRNFELNDLDHFEPLQSTAEHFLKDKARSRGIDCLIIDPPRLGLTPRAREGIAAAAPGSILYVSCDPATQARDAGWLVHRHKYHIAAAALFDLYPNTHHLETVLLMEKRRG